MERNEKRHLIISAHGIRDFGFWQDRLERIVREEASILDQDPVQIQVDSFKFGYFSLIAFLLPFARWYVTRRFTRMLERVSQEDHWDRIDFVGHSFGTHVLSYGLLRCNPNMRPNIHSIILSGSVLRSDFPWYKLLDANVGRVVNDCGTKDWVLLLSQFLVLFTGMAGRVGFSGALNSNFRNRFSMFGHGGYFGTGEVDPDLYMRKNWVPILLNDAPVDTWEDPRPSGAIHGILATIGDNIEPIKIATYVSPFVLLWLTYLSLFNSAQTANMGLLASAAGIEARSNLVERVELLPQSALLALAADQLQPTPESFDTLSRYNAILPELKAIHRISLDDPYPFVAMSNSTLAIAGKSRTNDVDLVELSVWNVDTSERIFHHSTDEPSLKSTNLTEVGELALSESGDKLAIAIDFDGEIDLRILDLHTHQMLDFAPISAEDSWVRFLKFSPDGSHIVIGTNDRIDSVNLHDQSVRTIASLPEGSSFPHYASNNGTIVVSTGRSVVLVEHWYSNTPSFSTRTIESQDTSSRSIDQVAMSTNGDAIAAISDFQTLMIATHDSGWTPKFLKLKQLLQSVAFFENEFSAYVQTADGEVLRIDYRGDELLLSPIPIQPISVEPFPHGFDVRFGEYGTWSATALRYGQYATITKRLPEQRSFQLSHSGRELNQVEFLENDKIISVDDAGVAHIWGIPGASNESIGYLSEKLASQKFVDTSQKGHCLFRANPNDEDHTKIRIQCQSDWSNTHEIDLEKTYRVLGYEAETESLTLSESSRLVSLRDWESENPALVEHWDGAGLEILAMSDDNLILVASRQDGKFIMLRRQPDGRYAQINEISVPDYVEKPVFESLSPGGAFLSIRVQRYVDIYRSADGVLLGSVPIPSFSKQGVISFNAAEDQVAIIETDETSNSDDLTRVASIYELGENELRKKNALPQYKPYELRYLPNGDLAIMSDGTIQVYDTKTGTARKKISVGQYGHGMLISSDGTLVFSSTMTGIGRLHIIDRYKLNGSVCQKLFGENLEMIDQYVDESVFGSSTFSVDPICVCRQIGQPTQCVRQTLR